MSTNEATINVVARFPGTNQVTINIVTQSAQAHIAKPKPIPHGFDAFWANTHHGVHIAVIVGMALIVHALVRYIRYFSELIITKTQEKKNPLGFVTQQPKFITLTRLIVSTVAFAVYAIAIYVILGVEFPNDNTISTYLGGAAVIGLALSFGMQGMVQDVVTGVTIILSDTMDAGDIVDLMNGVIGRVERVGLRFTKVINFYNQEIYVPNRNIMNISRYPHGGILAYADVQIPAKATDQTAVVALVQQVARGVWTQFAAIVLAEPIFREVRSTAGNWTYLRVVFKVWPGQTSIIETTFRAQIVNAMKTVDPAYADWQVVVTYRAMDH